MSTVDPAQTQDLRSQTEEDLLKTQVEPEASRQASSTGSMPKTIGEYEILCELGRGGMGVVYKARHQRLNRTAAVKVILAGDAADGESIRRFLGEGRAVAQLEHSGIVSVYEVGQDGDQHFMAMAFVDGPPLSELVRKAPLEPREAAALLLQATLAVQAAHDKGIVHRDLKPQNILVTRDQQARVVDFGLAKEFTRETSLTGTQNILGTPAYMPPEQAACRTSDIGPGSDIYSLGATLYCVLTGRPPFQASNLLETLRQVIEESPVPPRLLNPAIPADLQSICVKCLSKSVNDRYASCTELAADLRRFLDGEPVSVNSRSWMTALARTLRRSRDDVQLKSWGIILYYFAAIVWLTEVAICWKFWDGVFSAPFGFSIRALQFVAMAAVFWVHRSAWQKSPSVAAEQMWSLWLGFISACWMTAIVTVILQVLVYPEKGANALVVYPHFAIISGMLFCALGRSFWGYCYAFGAMFFILAVVFPFCLHLSPLLFGTVWGLVLVTLGHRLRGLAS